MARRRFNRNAVCNSDNYIVSKRSHCLMLRERHAHFNEMVVNGELLFDSPIFKDGKQTNKFKTIKVFGKEIKVTIEEYETHCKHLGL